MLEIAGEERASAVEPIGSEVLLAKSGQGGIAFDERDVFGHTEMKQRETDRPHARAQVDRAAYAATRLSGESSQKQRIDVGAIAVAGRRLKQLDAPAEERVFAYPSTRRGTHVSGRYSCGAAAPTKNGPGGISRATRPADFRAPYWRDSVHPPLTAAGPGQSITLVQPPG